MRTLAFSIALLAAAVPGAARAENPDSDVPAPAEDEAQLQELERILAENAPSQPRCEHAPVVFQRKGVAEPVSAQLVDCAGKPSADALAALSALAQPPAPPATVGVSSEKPDVAGPAAEPIQLNPGLLTRLQRIAEHFPDHAIDFVSGVRPKAGSGSRHRSGDALDIHVDGVEDLALAEFARGFDATGVGYYPNSTFVHIDVRDEAFSWVDRSHPGERPAYGPWPNADEQAAPVAEPTTDTAPANAQTAATATEPETATEPATDGVAEPVTDAVAEPVTDAVAEPETAAPPAVPDPELEALADRALLVMNSALGRGDGFESSAPTSMPQPEML